MTDKQIDEKKLDVVKSLRPVTGGALFQAPPGSLPVEVEALAFSVVKSIEKLAKDRYGALRAHLLDIVKGLGTENEKGGFRAEVAGYGALLAEKRQSEEPVAEKVYALLAAKGKEAVCVQTTIPAQTVFDPSKLEKLVKAGVITAEEVASCLGDPSWALKDFPNKEIRLALDEAKEAYLPESAPTLPAPAGVEIFPGSINALNRPAKAKAKAKK